MEVTLIYPHQLALDSAALDKKRPVYVIEEPLMMREFPVHAQKLMFHRLSMAEYVKQRASEGYDVTHFKIDDLKDTEDVFAILSKRGISAVHISDTTDVWLEKRIRNYAKKYALTTHRYESDLFLLDRDDSVERYNDSGKHMARFYKKMRVEHDILVDGQNPVGGKWSFDEENRKKIPKSHVVPEEIQALPINTDIEQAQSWVQSLEGIEIYGEIMCWLPYTHKSAIQWLDEFIQIRFAEFGTYEDAILKDHVRIHHSGISALLNVGLLTPQQVIDAIMKTTRTIPINSTEGFIRQVIGWREFMRAAYERDGNSMRTKNFFQHTRTLPATFWSGETSIEPVDDAIQKTLRYGYVHHIERLMVLGNVMLLSEINPDEVYRWFMAMYVDAYDWVMVPNVYGMSQFADGGSFATKPYIAGANYIRKMSDYPKGGWEDTMTGLYWHFIQKNKETFLANHRMSMMPRLWEKMDPKKQDSHLMYAKKFYSDIIDR